MNDTLPFDSNRVAAIVSNNSFGSRDFNRALAAKIDVDRPKTTFHGCGVWILASYMNHSCTPNTAVFFAGDLMMVRAAKRIRKGDEVTASYISLSGDYKERQASLAEHGFKCGCELCICDLQRSTDEPSLDEERRAFMESFNAMLVERIDGLFRGLAISFLDDMTGWAALFSARFAFKDRYDPCLERLYIRLATCFTCARQWIKAASAYERSYFACFRTGAGDDFLASTLTVDAFRYCCDIADSYKRGGDVAKAKEWLGKMRQAAIVAWGSADEALLAMLYPELPIKQLFKSLT